MTGPRGDAEQVGITEVTRASEDVDEVGSVTVSKQCSLVPASAVRQEGRMTKT